MVGLIRLRVDIAPPSLTPGRFRGWRGVIRRGEAPPNSPPFVCQYEMADICISVATIY